MCILNFNQSYARGRQTRHQVTMEMEMITFYTCYYTLLFRVEV